MKRLLAAGVILSALSIAQTHVLADQPATAPAPYVFSAPAGMTLFTLAGYTAVAPQHYADLVRAGLGNVIPATMPTTMASDMLQKLAASRQALAAAMVADLALPPEKVAAFLDGPLRTKLRQTDLIHPRFFIIVASQDELTAALKSGWSAPRFHYNPMADATVYDPAIPVALRESQDDIVLWTQVRPGQSDDDICTNMKLQIHNFQTGFAYASSQEARLQGRMQLVSFINDNIILPLKLPDTEQWFGYGVAGVLSSKYESMFTGIPRDTLTTIISSDSANNPIQSAPIDLFHEFDTSTIKPDYLPLYIDAIGRKGTAVVARLVARAGDAAILEIVNSIRAKMPRDNAALVEIIKEDTGVDLTADLLPPQ